MYIYLIYMYFYFFKSIIFIVHELNVNYMFL